MSITFTWKVLDKTILPERGVKLKNIVTDVTWECTGVDSNSGKSFTVTETTTLKPALPKEFTPLVDVTDDEMLRWVYERISKKAIENQITDSIGKDYK